MAREKHQVRREGEQVIRPLAQQPFGLLLDRRHDVERRRRAGVIKQRGGRSPVGQGEPMRPAGAAGAVAHDQRELAREIAAGASDDRAR